MCPDDTKYVWGLSVRPECFPDNKMFIYEILVFPWQQNIHIWDLSLSMTTKCSYMRPECFHDNKMFIHDILVLPWQHNDHIWDLSVSMTTQSSYMRPECFHDNKMFIYETWVFPWQQHVHMMTNILPLHGYRKMQPLLVSLHTYSHCNTTNA